jgi:hypothetical protein
VPDFIGGDPESNASECPAVFVIPQTGDFVFRGQDHHRPGAAHRTHHLDVIRTAAARGMTIRRVRDGLEPGHPRAEYKPAAWAASATSYQTAERIMSQARCRVQQSGVPAHSPN